MTTEREAWLTLTIEDPIDPELPICDPHHHLWDRPNLRGRPGSRYLLEELLQDTGGGHNIVQSVFVECRSMYRKDGSDEMRPVGETEFVQGIAAQSASGQYGITLGGLGMPICGFGWHEKPIPPSSAELAEAMVPYYGFSIEQFGVNRCMFESNFPVDKQSYSYTVMWNAFKRIAKDFSPKDRAALFHDTAIKVYRLETNHRG